MTTEATSKGKLVGIKKVDAEQRLVYGEVFAPNVLDSYGDFMTAVSIQKMAHQFMAKGRVANIDVNHSQEVCGAYVVESFIAREGDPDFIPGSWVVGVKIPDDQIWSLVKSSELNGFSFDGIGMRRETELVKEIPDYLTGETTLADGHKHTFKVEFDADGGFLGGRTDPAPDGHWHEIIRGTLTEQSSGHAHRFSFAEGLSNA